MISCHRPNVRGSWDTTGTPGRVFETILNPLKSRETADEVHRQQLFTLIFTPPRAGHGGVKTPQLLFLHCT